MTSKAEALFVCKSFDSNLLPNASPEVAVATLLKKKQGDATFSLQFSDATLRDPRSGKGLVVAAEKPLAGALANAPQRLACSVVTTPRLQRVLLIKFTRRHAARCHKTQSCRGFEGHCGLQCGEAGHHC
jgi:hypothetical protein